MTIQVHAHLRIYLIRSDFVAAISCQDETYLRVRKGFIVLAVFVVGGFPLYIVAGLMYAKKRGYFDAKNHLTFARHFGSLSARLTIAV